MGLKIVLSNKLAYTFIAIGILILVAFSLNATPQTDFFGHDYADLDLGPISISGNDIDIVGQVQSSSLVTSGDIVDGGKRSCSSLATDGNGLIICGSSSGGGAWTKEADDDIYYSDGWVGIGISPVRSSQYKLHVDGGIRLYDYLFVEDDKDRLRLLDTGGNSAWIEVDSIRASGGVYNDVRPGAGDVYAEGKVTGSQLCIGTVCKSSWPTGGGDDGDWIVSGDNLISGVSGGVGIGRSSFYSTGLEVDGNIRVGTDSGAKIHTYSSDGKLMIADRTNGGGWIEARGILATRYNYGAGDTPDSGEVIANRRVTTPEVCLNGVCKTSWPSGQTLTNNPNVWSVVSGGGSQLLIPFADGFCFLVGSATGDDASVCQVWKGTDNWWRLSAGGDRASCQARCVEW